MLLHWAYVFQFEGLEFNGKRLLRTERWRDGLDVKTSYSMKDGGGIDTGEGERIERFESSGEKNGHSWRKVEVWAVDGKAHLDDQLRRIAARGVGAGKVELREWVSLTWAAVVGSDDPRHVRAGTGCEQIKSRAGVMYYASKYVCKADTEAVGNAGRFWGIHNVKFIPWASLEVQCLSGPQAIRFMRVAKRYIRACQRQRGHRKKIRWRRGCGMTFFCDATSWLQRLPQLASG
jgi:hypothetical protein